MENFAIVSCYYNPTQNPFRLKNYNRFKESLPRGVQHFNVELTYGDKPNEIEDKYSTRLIADPKKSLMWQKEALLNWQIKAIVDQFEYIAWLDSDIIFTNKYWASEARALLDSYEVIQLFDEVSNENERGRFVYSLRDTFGRAIQSAEDGFDPTTVYCGKAWAARSEWLSVDPSPLFYISPLGGNDIFQTAAFMSPESMTYKKLIGSNEEFSQWVEYFAQEKRTEEISYLPNQLLHCYHKEVPNSENSSRLSILDAFEPNSSVCLQDDILCWKGTTPSDLQEFCEQYMILRGIDD